MASDTIEDIVRETHTGREWAEILGISYGGFKARCSRYKGNADRIFAPGSSKVRCTRKGKLYTWNGKTMDLRGWARECGISYEAMKSRHLRFGDDSMKMFENGSQRERVIQHGGVRRSIKGWAEFYGVTHSGFCSMLRKRGARATFRWFDRPYWERHSGVEWRGRKISYKDASVVSGVGVGRLYSRVADGFNGDKLFSTDDLKCRYLTVRGVRKSVSEWAGDNGIEKGAMYARIRKWGACPAVVDKPMLVRRRGEQENLRRELASMGIIF